MYDSMCLSCKQNFNFHIIKIITNTMILHWAIAANLYNNNQHIVIFTHKSHNNLTIKTEDTAYYSITYSVVNVCES